MNNLEKRIEQLERRQDDGQDLAYIVITPEQMEAGEVPHLRKPTKVYIAVNGFRGPDEWDEVTNDRPGQAS